MDNQQQKSKTDLPAQSRSDGLSAASVGAIAFVVGYLAPLILWYITLPAPDQCPPPCDGPGMALAGIIIFGGPIVGLMAVIIALLVRALIKRREQRHAA